MRLSKVSLLSMLVSRIVTIRRRTLILASVAVLTVAVVVLWLAISLAGWLFGLLQEGTSVVPEVARGAVKQMEKVVPGATQVIDDLRVLGQAEPPEREISGTDPLPMERFPGFIRTHWQSENQEIKVRYEGTADLTEVLAHYGQGFSEHGYRQELYFSTSKEEHHDYVKGDERIRIIFARQNGNRVSVAANLSGQ